MVINNGRFGEHIERAILKCFIMGMWMRGMWWRKRRGVEKCLVRRAGAWARVAELSVCVLSEPCGLDGDPGNARDSGRKTRDDKTGQWRFLGG